MQPFLADFLRPCLHLERLERLDLRLERLDLRLERLDLRLERLDLRLERLDLRLDLRLRLERLGPGLRLHTLDPFLIPREHLRFTRLERLRRFGPGLALHPFLKDFLRPCLHGLLDLRFILCLGIFYYLKENNKKLHFKL